MRKKSYNLRERERKKYRMRDSNREISVVPITARIPTGGRFSVF